VSPDRAQYKLSRRQAMYTVGLLSAIALFNGIDLSILPAVSSLLQREFSLADYQVGALGAAYVLVYAFETNAGPYIVDAGWKAVGTSRSCPSIRRARRHASRYLTR